MKVFKNKSNKGFTLIELMVVISIIAFLSSIVLVSVKEVKEKSQISVFRSEMNQLITALELYKTSTGKYPYEDTLSGGVRYIYARNNNNTETVTVGGVTLSAILTLSYIQSISKIPSIYPGSLSVWTYASNFGAGGSRAIYRCGNEATPKFVIYISSGYPKYINAMSHWTNMYFSYDNSTWYPQSGVKCYSSK